jgi:hypothetical protein
MAQVPQKVLFCGSRDWVDVEAIRAEIVKLNPGDIVILGAARGADTIAGHLAEQYGFEVRAMPAEWGRFGNSAGLRRNADMVAIADRVVAFTLPQSRGTHHTIGLARAKKIPVTVIDRT